MNISLLITFIILSFVNVILQTIKSLLTISGTRLVSAVSNAIAYGLYTVVVVYTVCDLPLWLKIIIVAVTNFFGVYISKWLVDKFSKDRLWKWEIALPKRFFKAGHCELEHNEIPFNYVEVDEWIMFNCYCMSQKQSEVCGEIAKRYNGKISAYESKI